MNLICAFIALLGVVLMIICLIWLRPVIGLKLLDSYSILTLTHHIRLKDKGKYTISIVGGNVREEGNFRVRISSAEKEIPVNRNKLKSWQNFGVWTIGTNLYNFTLEKGGTYLMTIEYPRDLIVEKRISMFHHWFLPAVKHEKLSIVIQKRLPTLKILLALLMILFAFVLWTIAAYNYQF